MSTPAVRMAVTERRANTNAINTSALTPGTSWPCASLCLMALESCSERDAAAKRMFRHHFVTFCLKKRAVCDAGATSPRPRMTQGDSNRCNLHALSGYAMN